MSRLTSLNTSFKTNEKKLNVFFIINFVKMNEFFRNRLLKNYNNDLVWKKIFNLLDTQESVENNAFFFFIDKTNWFFVQTIVRSTNTHSSFVVCASHNHWSSKFLIQFMKSSMSTQDSTNVMSEFYRFILSKN